MEELPDDFEIPDDISALFARSPSRVVYVLPVVSAKVGAALAALLELDVLCIESPNGVLALGKDADEETVAQYAHKITSLNDKLQVTVIRRGPSADPAASDVQASVWAGGEKVRDLPAGLVLSTAADELERLIVQLHDASDFKGVESTSLSKPAALKVLASRRARRQVEG